MADGMEVGGSLRTLLFEKQAHPELGPQQQRNSLDQVICPTPSPSEMEIPRDPGPAVLMRLTSGEGLAFLLLCGHVTERTCALRPVLQGL